MSTSKSFLLIFIAAISGVNTMAWAQNNLIKSNFFIFANPTTKRNLDSRDNNVYEKMKYYGYRGGAQPTTFFITDGLNDKKYELTNAADETAFDQAVSAAIDSFKSFIQVNLDRFPPRRDSLSGMYDKFFIPWNANCTYCYLVDSLIRYPGANKRNKAVEVVAKSISAADTLFRQLYGCDSIIHQVCEEMQSQWNCNKGSDYTFESYFPKYTQYNLTAGYRLFFSVMNSIAGQVEQRTPATSETAIEWYYERKQTESDTIPTNNQAFRAEAFDSLLNVDVFFMQATGRDPEYILRQSNWVADSISSNGRKLGVRYTWCRMSTSSSIIPSASDQLKSLQDISNFFTNAKYLSIVFGDQLDGRVENYNIDASQHFKALSYWLDKNYLHLVDKLYETYVDTAWWNQSGTVTAHGDTATISSNSNLVSKVNFGKSTTRSVFKRKGSLSSGQEIGIHLQGDSFIKFFTVLDTPYVTIRGAQGPPVTTKYAAWGRVTPDVLHEFKIYLDGSYAVFHIDGSYVTDEDFVADEDRSLKLYTTTGNSSMTIDSTSALGYSKALPRIRLTDCGVDTVPQGPDTLPRPRASFSCDAPAIVKAFLIKYPYGTLGGQDTCVQFYNSGDNVTSGNVLYLMSTAYDSGYYRIILSASNAGGIDTVYSNGFFWRKSTETILASAGKSVGSFLALPQAFSLSQNSPNPFNPSTTISYEIPEKSELVNVTLNVYNIRGQLIKSLVSREEKGPGRYQVTWDGMDNKGHQVSSGVYFYRLKAGDFMATRKMIILK